ncbi:MAG: hypothetical protein MUC99_06275 [Anaerolineae bacterium]|nr:hypothetical protein [Anaerolineae bacterium]
MIEGKTHTVKDDALMEPIISLQNERVKLANALQHRPRARRKHMKIAVEGDRLIKDALDRRQRPDFVLYDPATADAALVALLNKIKVLALPVNAEVLAHVSATEEPQGLVGVFPIPMPPLPKTPRRVLVMDALGDPVQPQGVAGGHGRAFPPAGGRGRLGANRGVPRRPDGVRRRRQGHPRL